MKVPRRTPTSWNNLLKQNKNSMEPKMLHGKFRFKKDIITVDLTIFSGTAFDIISDCPKDAPEFAKTTATELILEATNFALKHIYG